MLVLLTSQERGRDSVMTGINTFINGEFTSVEKACLSIEDRGMLFGDGVYEFTRCYIDGKPLQLEAHLQRFFNSAAAIELELPYTKEEITAIVDQLLAKSGARQAGIYLQATRGTAFPRTHYFPKAVKPNFFIIVREIEPEPPEVMGEGLKAILVPDQRWARCDIKSLNLLPNVLAKEKAVRQGAFEAIFYNDDGVTEAASSSVFSVFDDVLYTTPPGNWVLPGITSSIVTPLSAQIGHPVKFAFIPKEKFLQADEVFITNSRVDVAPIIRIGEHMIGNGKPGPVTIAVKQAFLRFAREE